MRQWGLGVITVSVLIVLNSVLSYLLGLHHVGQSMGDLEVMIPSELLQSAQFSAAWQSALVAMAALLSAVGLRWAMARDLWGLGKYSWVSGRFGDPNLVNLGLLNKRDGRKSFFASKVNMLLRDAEEIERRLGLIIDNIGEGIITIDDRGNIGSFNPACERIFGWAAEAVIGRRINMLMPKEIGQAHDAYLRRYSTTGKRSFDWSGRIERARRADGSEFPIELTVTEILLSGRRVYVGIIRDITEREVAEKAKAEFLATISHELRTPLTSIRGALGMLQSGALDAGKMQRVTEIAVQNSDRLGRLIDSILDMEKLEAGKLKLNKERLDLCKVVRDSLEAFSGYAEKYGVSYEIPDYCESATVIGDRERLLQVLANLLSNAVKFSHAGGAVRVSGALNEATQRFRIEVSDQGCGIPEEAQATIFDMFTQADASDNRARGGTGLGLGIARKIVELHGGTIDFVSEVGVGTTFFFELPVEPVPVAAKKLPAAACA